MRDVHDHRFAGDVEQHHAVRARRIIGAPQLAVASQHIDAVRVAVGELPPFQAALNAGARSVMAAFNEVDGVPMHAHEALIDGVLRDRWGWDGILVSDYTGVMELIPHGVAADSGEAGLLALRAGVDVDMVSAIYLRKVPALVRAGRIPESQLDDAVRRVLRAKYQLGLFEDPYRYSDTTRERTLALAPEHLADLVHGLRHSGAALAHSPARFWPWQGGLWLEDDSVVEQGIIRYSLILPFVVLHLVRASRHPDHGHDVSAATAAAWNTRTSRYPTLPASRSTFCSP